LEEEEEEEEEEKKTTTRRVCSLYTAANAAGSFHQIYPTFRNCYKIRTAELQLFVKIYNNPQYLLQKQPPCTRLSSFTAL